MCSGRYLDRLRAQQQSWAQDWVKQLQQWQALEEEPERTRLARDLESDADGTFFAAAFELFLSGSFRQRGWGLERHPTVPGTKRVPDYLVHTARGDLFVEAVLARESDAKLAQDHVLRALSDALEPVEGPFHVIVTPTGRWDGRFSRKKVRQFLQDQVRDVEEHPDEPERSVTYSQDEHLPLRFDILRTDTEGPVVGAWMVTGDTAVMVTTHLTLADAIDKKVTATVS